MNNGYNSIDNPNHAEHEKTDDISEHIKAGLWFYVFSFGLYVIAHFI